MIWRFLRIHRKVKRQRNALKRGFGSTNICWGEVNRIARSFRSRFSVNMSISKVICMSIPLRSEDITWLSLLLVCLLDFVRFHFISFIFIVLLVCMCFLGSSSLSFEVNFIKEYSIALPCLALELNVNCRSHQVHIDFRITRF